jgi:hypothetical protein
VIATSETNPAPGWAYTYAAQLYCSHWNGSTWVTSASLNQNTANWAADVSMTSVGAQPYVAWTERSQTGNAQLFVKTWNGSGWVNVGSGDLNKSSAGWAFRPRLATDGSKVYASWEEAVTPTTTTPGQPSRVFVAEWTGSSWLALGNTALNVDLVNGTAAHNSIAVVEGSPVVMWSESQTGQLQQIYAKRWNGAGWVLLPPLQP